jgi:hypothetical protein
MSDYAKEVKKVPFDGTKESFYLWTTQLIGAAKTYHRNHAILGTVVMPQSIDILDETQDAENRFLLAKKMNDTAMFLFNLSLTDKASPMTLYNCITTELPDVAASKV